MSRPYSLMIVIAAIAVTTALVFVACGDGSGPGLPKPPDLTKPDAWAFSTVGDDVAIRTYDHGNGTTPTGFTLVDTFELINKFGRDVTGPVDIVLKLAQALTPGTLVYIYQVVKETGAVVPVASTKVENDGRTIRFRLLHAGKFLLLILNSDVPNATSFKVWAFADFAIGVAPIDVNFFAFHDGGVEPIVYRWDFGDRNEGEGETVTNKYLAIGEYDVVLRATDAAGRKATYSSTSISITGEPAPLSTTLQAPQATGNPREFRFIATISGGVAPFTYAWDFGDGTTSTLQNPTHTYIETGVYAISVTITDALGNTARSGTQTVDCRSVDLSSGTLAGQRDFLVNFNVLAGLDDNNPTKLTLAFGEGNAPQIISDFNDIDLTIDRQIQHLYTAVGIYTVTLTAETLFNSQTYTISDSVQVVVGFGTPVINNITPTEGFSGDVITITGRYFEVGTNGFITWNGAQLQTDSWTDSQITFTVPNSTTNGAIQVENEGLQSNVVNFRVIPNSPDWNGGGLGQL